MLVKVFGAAVQGIDAIVVTIEVNCTRHKAVWKLMRSLGLFRTFYCAKFVVKCTCKNMQYSLFDIMWLTGNGE